MKERNSFSQKEISNKINNLRLKLNEVYITKGHTQEVVSISQELDKYIVVMQEELIKEIK